jgi:hypothetical protein
MIVNATADGWEIFYHRAHALLAAQIGLQVAWQVGERPARLAETLAALFQHDDLVLEWDSELIGPAGTPLDFTLQAALQSRTPADVDLQPQIKLVEHALYRGRWVAMLVSMHCCFLLESKPEKPKEMQKFIKEQRAMQQRWQRELGIAPEIADHAYALMQWCDRISLILCKRELPSRERWLEVSAGPDGRRYDAQQRKDGTIDVQPWPFSTPVFTVDAEMIHLAQPAFKNNDELIAAMRAAPVNTVEWQFVQGGAHAKGRFDRKRHKQEKARALPRGEE